MATPACGFFGACVELAGIAVQEMRLHVSDAVTCEMGQSGGWEGFRLLLFQSCSTILCFHCLSAKSFEIINRCFCGK